ncbi:MAG TPA: nucleotidyltransferase domain-containing protein [Gemmatimonadaceae bacterium]
MTLDEFVTQLRGALGGDLRTMAVYGSAAAGEHHAGKSDVNVLVVVDSLSTERLAAASASVAAWIEGGHTAPLMLTTEEWSGSADIFAMEFADIQERHRLLHGAFPTEIKVDLSNLRLQLEREAMVAVLQLRRATLATGHDGKALLQVLDGGASTILALFRAVTRLRGESPPKDDGELVTSVAKAAGCDPAPFVRVVQHRRGTVALKPADAAQVVTGCLDGLQRIVRYLDQYKGRS